MTKRKILMLAMSICMVAILAVGGTLAYFTDTDDATNVFTMGVVEIDLIEDFVQESELFPGQDVNKDVYVKNTGSNSAYVRVHIAIPAELDDGDPSFVATNNFLHFNFTKDSVQAGRWSWLPEYTEGVGYLGNGEGNWNYYETTIDEVEYAVYVVTYRTVLGAGETTPWQALDKVYLDKSVDAKYSDDRTQIIYTDDKDNVAVLDVVLDKNGEPTGKVNFDIKVIAEATQDNTFANAYDALNTAFGVPGEYDAWANYVAD